MSINGINSFFRIENECLNLEKTNPKIKTFSKEANNIVKLEKLNSKGRNNPETNNMKYVITALVTIPDSSYMLIILDGLDSNIR